MSNFAIKDTPLRPTALGAGVIREGLIIPILSADGWSIAFSVRSNQRATLL